MGALTFLNRAGDTTITWSSDLDDFWEAIIKKKMDEGFVFWIIEPRGARRPLTEFAEAKKYRRVAMGDAEVKRAFIPDEDVLNAVEAGKGDLVKTPAAPVRGSRISKDAKEIAKSESVAVRSPRGG